jgi:hypothetical protein
MSRNLHAATTLAAVAAVAAAAVAAIVSPKAANAAGDISVDPVPFVSSTSRAQVREQLLEFPASGGDGEGTYAATLTQGHGAVNRVDLRDEYKASRDEVNAMGGEDSGSTYLKSHAAAANPAAIMGGPGLLNTTSPEEAPSVPE